MGSGFRFRVVACDGAARRGEMHTAHGIVETPAFMPVGTRGTVKALTHRDLIDLGAQILLANTYHLHLRPGDSLIARHGGLHRFLGWQLPILTDSGGYQVFSLAARRTIDESGVTFRSHLDGSRCVLTPEGAVDVQARLGSDVSMVLDECGPYPASVEDARRTMDRTLRWAERARRHFLTLVDGSGPRADPPPQQAQFGIVQGGVHRELRVTSARQTAGLGFDGLALGGLSVGEPAALMDEIVESTVAWLPSDRPRYLMGTGTPRDIVEAVRRGVDLFDCVLPTRNARNGQLFTRHGRLNIKQARYAEDAGPPDDACACYTCRQFSRAYLRHLFMAGEMTSATLNTLHNLYFYLDLMRRIREAIAFGSLDRLYQEVSPAFAAPDDRSAGD